MMEEDKTYYQAFLNGEIQGFEQLVLKYKDHVIYFINRYVKDVHIAEDLAQDAFVDVYLYKERYQFSYGFKTYLFTIARNKAVDYVRKNVRNGSSVCLEEMEACKEEQRIEDKIVLDERNRHLRDAIKMLKPKAQLVLHLTYFEQMSGKEVARILGLTQGQVKVMLHRARKQLGERLGKDIFYM